MKGYADLGGNIGELIGTFLNKDAIQQQGYNDYAPKFAQARYYNTKADEAAFDLEQKRQSAAITPEQIAQSFFGIDRDTMGRIMAGDTDQYGDAGPTIPLDPITVDQGRRAAGIHAAHRMGGGNVDQILSALLQGQRLNAQDNVLAGNYDPGQVARAVAAAEGKSLYSDGTSGILDIFSGDVTPTARTKAAMASDYASANANNELAEERKRGKTGGAKDPARAKMIELMIKRGVPDDVAWEIGMMDSVPKEQFLKLVSSINSSAMVPDLKKAEAEARVIMESLYGKDWDKMLSGERGAATAPVNNDPLGIR